MPQSDRITFISNTDSASFYLGRMNPIDSAVINEKGEFSISFKMKTPKVFGLKCRNVTLVSNLFVMPGVP